MSTQQQSEGTRGPVRTRAFVSWYGGLLIAVAMAGAALGNPQAGWAWLVVAALALLGAFGLVRAMAGRVSVVGAADARGSRLSRYREAEIPTPTPPTPDQGGLFQGAGRPDIAIGQHRGEMP